MGTKITIALMGNPNSGKTTIFNNLTGARQHVGNYPGVTVEKKEGYLKYKGYEIRVVDLPGTYSLTAQSEDEIVARNFILQEKPDVVVDIVDASNLERNLYLAVQLMELGVNLIITLNMWDLANKMGLRIDEKKLSELLGVPCIPAVATRRQGMEELLERAIALSKGKIFLRRKPIRYGKEIEEEIRKIEEIVRKDGELAGKYAARWIAVKLLENDEEVREKVRASAFGREILSQAEKSSAHLEGVFGDEVEAVIPDRRYGFISGACSRAVKKSYEVRHTISDRIDRILLNRILGLPIFLGMMWLMFKLVFKLSEPMMGWIESFMGWLGGFLGNLLPEESAIHSLVVDGIIGGVGSVLVFVPIIFLLFLAIAILEDSGYLARGAFIMDRLMHKIGLHGRSFIPMMLGFGCNLPGIMATRVIEDKKARLVTILVNPFMSCGARLPVYTLFVGAFFSERHAGNVLFSLYLLGILVAIIMAKLFRKYLFKGAPMPFVMELPPYRLPTLKGALLHMWERGGVYLKKAGTVIFAGCILIWALSNFPYNIQYSRNYQALIEKAKDKEELVSKLKNERAEEKLEKSFAGRIGKAVAPVFRPLGFGDWKPAVALMAGFIAKEIVVGTLGTLHAVGEEEESLREALRKAKWPDGRKVWTPLVAYAFMVFVLLYIPCVATIGVIYRETNSFRWPLFAAFYTTGIAWILAFLVFQGGKALGLG